MWRLLLRLLAAAAAAAAAATLAFCIWCRSCGGCTYFHLLSIYAGCDQFGKFVTGCCTNGSEKMGFQNCQIEQCGATRRAPEEQRQRRQEKVRPLLVTLQSHLASLGTTFIHGGDRRHARGAECTPAKSP